ncbi:hypothetical protein V8E55_009954 [Tylopilus felleus]
MQISGWKFDELDLTIRQLLCEALYVAGHIKEARESLLNVVDTVDKELYMTRRPATTWVSDFKSRCGTKLEERGDLAMNVRKYDEAMSHYSAAISLNPVIPLYLFIKRSKVYMAMRSWGNAIDDVNRVIMLNPHSPWGYEKKRVALHKAGRYSEAVSTFETMLWKASQLPDPEIRELVREYVHPDQTKTVIRAAVDNAVLESPLVLINTDSGRLLDKQEQASSFESQPIFWELISSMTTRIDHARIEREVSQYYRYATFSHKWEANEPLFENVIRIVVHDLEASLTHKKLQVFCMIVRDLGFHWAWSDTCCINKADHFVLQEALVTMFKWYEGSSTTIVLLRGVRFPPKRGDLAKSIWNTRAWTLQEYHASKVVRFYTEDWRPYLTSDIPNHKESPEIIAEMEEATGVSARALMTLRPGLDDIREKLRLASTRHTTRIEDAAYSLLGIFSMSLPVVYGEGDKALGRFLAQLLTSSGDTSILAWKGRSSTFNSCLPASITAFSQLPTTHVPQALARVEMDQITARLRGSSLSSTSIMGLYDRLQELHVPLFAGQRMKLPCIAFKLGPLTVSRSGSRHVFRAQTGSLGVIDITTVEDLSRFDSLYLIHPWIDFLLDRQPVGSVFQMIPEESADDRSSLIGELPSFPGPSGIATLQMRAFQALARLKQPFGALLLTPNPGKVAAYRRVAADSLITVKVEEITPAILNKLVDSIRTMDVL